MSYVVDASAVIAILFREDGFEGALPYLRSGVLSDVNRAEVYQRYVRNGEDPDGLDGVLRKLGLSFDRPRPEDAEVAGRLGTIRNLALADRYCIATAARLGVPAVTADRPWADLDLPVAVELIR